MAIDERLWVPPPLPPAKPGHFIQFTVHETIGLGVYNPYAVGGVRSPWLEGALVISDERRLEGFD
jgi:hypothetical protein